MIRGGRREALVGVCRKLEEEKNKEVRELIQLSKKIQDMKKSLAKGAGGVYRPAYRELIRRNEGYHREREGVEIGLERAIDLIEQVEEEPEQQGSPPAHPPLGRSQYKKGRGEAHRPKGRKQQTKQDI